MVSVLCFVLKCFGSGEFLYDIYVYWQRRYINHSRLLDKIMTLKTHQLQSWVRSSFLSMPITGRSEEYRTCLSAVVQTSLNVNVTTAVSAKPYLMQAEGLFQQFLQSGSVSDMDKVNIAIASASIQGKLQQHPLIQGLTLSCYKQLERQERGLAMQGRDKANSMIGSDLGKSLVQQAGATLALAGGNKEMLKLFGRSLVSCSPNVANLHAKSLPNPVLALDNPERLRTNLALIDQRLSASTQSSG